ncbi:hypothetical protein H2248_006003 [Termitomyces sp. 'cryptogamus']|nr:hypothetical protein H2248_006003 [Termitomyces sp. 'cryptogamus']
MSSLSTILVRSTPRFKSGSRQLAADIFELSLLIGSDRCDADIVLMTSLRFALNWVTNLRRMGLVSYHLSYSKLLGLFLCRSTRSIRFQVTVCLTESHIRLGPCRHSVSRV